MIETKTKIASQQVGRFGQWQIIQDRQTPGNVYLRTTQGSFYVSLCLDSKALKHLREALDLSQSILEGAVKVNERI